MKSTFYFNNKNWTTSNISNLSEADVTTAIFKRGACSFAGLRMGQRELLTLKREGNIIIDFDTEITASSEFMDHEHKTIIDDIRANCKTTARASTYFFHRHYIKLCAKRRTVGENGYQSTDEIDEVMRRVFNTIETMY